MCDASYRRRNVRISVAYMAAVLVASASTAGAANLKSPSSSSHHKSRTSVDAIVQSYFVTGEDAGLRPNSPALEGVTRLGWTVTQSVGSLWKVVYGRRYVDETRGRVTNAKGQYVYPPLMQDQIDDLHAAYPVGKMSLQLGYAYRQRLCCPGSADPSVKEPATWHEYYVQTGAGFGPFIGGFGNVFAAQARVSYMPHDPSHQFYATLPSGMSPEGPHFKFSGSLTAAAPIAPRLPLIAFVTYAYNSSYLENAPYPYLYNELDFGFTRRVSPNVSSQLMISNKTQHLQGYPYVYRV